MKIQINFIFILTREFLIARTHAETFNIWIEHIWSLYVSHCIEYCTHDIDQKIIERILYNIMYMVLFPFF